MPRDLSFSALRTAYTAGSLKPSNVISDLYSRLHPDDGTFVILISLEDAKSRCRELEEMPSADRPPLWGIPFAVKDNIDVEGFNTTAGCRDFAFRPEDSAPAVQALLNAGAIMIGKTNMDQFAAGLVGTRTPFNTAPNAFDSRFIPGGSSSGSGAAVGAGLVSFALGTDTAGSGRIPAGFNGCVGLKATLGRVSTTGVVPACASLDCLTCFATTVRDAATVVQIMQEAGNLSDPNWRLPDPNFMDQQYMGGGFTFGVPDAEHLDFSGPGGPALETKYRELFQEAIKAIEKQGGQQVEINFSPFATTAKLLYESAFVAERYSGIRSFLETNEAQKPTAEQIAQDDRLEKVIGAILSGAVKYTAADVYDGNVKLKNLKALARVQMAKVDMLMVPTALHHYTVQEIAEEERHADKITWTRNAKLGRFTNFVNLLDMCAVSVPSGVYQHPAITGGLLGDLQLSNEAAQRRDQLGQSGSSEPTLPFGVTMIASAWRDNWLCEIASRFHQDSGMGCGPAGHAVHNQSELANGHL